MITHACIALVVIGCAVSNGGGSRESGIRFWAEEDGKPLIDPSFRKKVLPTEQELAFMQIPWLPSLHQGVERAYEGQKPLLLWLMNGHPLGCT
ncbi:MAG: hypothetical protein ACPGXK_15250 [Phycisphaerae bacterium]